MSLSFWLCVSYRSRKILGSVQAPTSPSFCAVFLIFPVQITRSINFPSPNETTPKGPPNGVKKKLYESRKYSIDSPEIL
ncbi:hypothetical protein E2C01_032938 [Portunus trituberculatus]|uniref:Uncharacterized protein n=1 Tax=Portunus trituberculatus TaxID=210409 RepID=A0A5B7F2U7_PORTR|nr:hypothetical protein [Portunus trituberculatus]